MIRVQGLTKSFHGQTSNVLALDDVNLEIQEGEFFVLLGPSGSGKTTLLRCIAGLEKPDKGEIYFNSELMYSGSGAIFVSPEARKLGMVFQSYAIWPHMTVGQNIGLPLREGKARIPREQVQGRVSKALDLVGLSGFEQRPAPLLSGGQQQRVALARALAVEPSIMLMDEPLSNLDARLREEVRREIKKLTTDIGVTTLYVTHDQGEAMALADRIAIMDKGRMLQIGSAEDLYMRPKHPRVARFLGAANWFSCKLGSDRVIETGFGRLHLDAQPTVNLIGETEITIAVRPECIRLSQDISNFSARNNTFSGEIISQIYLGDHRLYSVKVGREILSVKLPFNLVIKGQVIVEIPSSALMVFPLIEEGQ